MYTYLSLGGLAALEAAYLEIVGEPYRHADDDKEEEPLRDHDIRLDNAGRYRDTK